MVLMTNLLCMNLRSIVFLPLLTLLLVVRRIAEH